LVHCLKKLGFTEYVVSESRRFFESRRIVSLESFFYNKVEVNSESQRFSFFKVEVNSESIGSFFVQAFFKQVMNAAEVRDKAIDPKQHCCV